MLSRMLHVPAAMVAEHHIPCPQRKSEEEDDLRESLSAPNVVWGLRPPLRTNFRGCAAAVDSNAPAVALGFGILGVPSKPLP